MLLFLFLAGTLQAQEEIEDDVRYKKRVENIYIQMGKTHSPLYQATVRRINGYAFPRNRLELLS